MLLSSLLKNVEVEKIIGKINIDINAIEINSSSVVEDNLYIALCGTKSDGHDFIETAIKYGAKAIVCEREMPVSVTQIVVKNSRIAYSMISSNFYNNAHKRLKIIGVTGTNGKTSCAYIIYSILNNCNKSCGFIGTIGTFYNSKKYDSNLTTPDPKELHKTLLDMEIEGVEYVAMEVSAHSIFFDKIYGLEFEVLLFTNLTQDHLDFFNNMEDYKKSKLKLFENYKSKYIVTNNDDAVGKLIGEKNGSAITYGIENPSDIFAINVEEKKEGLKFIMNLFDMVYDVKVKLCGLFNVYNLLGACTVVALLGVAPDRIYESLCNLETVNGRIEKIYSKGFSIYIDYAHTPDGLEKILKSLRVLCNKKLICVFGCGGNRDKSKRKIMGKISGENADFTIITSDNPRFEEPMEIIFDIESGVLQTKKQYVIIQDRLEAISYAINMATDGDIILIAGKGSEKFQEILGIKKPYNDKDTVMGLLGEKKFENCFTYFFCFVCFLFYNGIDCNSFFKKIKNRTTYIKICKRT